MIQILNNIYRISINHQKMGSKFYEEMYNKVLQYFYESDSELKLLRTKLQYIKKIKAMKKNSYKSMMCTGCETIG